MEIAYMVVRTGSAAKQSATTTKKKSRDPKAPPQSLPVAASSHRQRRMAVDERHTASQGLYPHPDIDLKKLNRLILEAKLAPCYSGSDDPRPDIDECTIYFLDIKWPISAYENIVFSGGSEE